MFFLMLEVGLHCYQIPLKTAFSASYKFWEMTLEGPLDCKEIQPVHPKGDQSWVFIVRTDIEAETPILWPPDAKSWLIWKGPDAGKDWGQEKETSEDKMVGSHHRLNGHGFGWTPGVGDRQGGLACCSSWGRKESDMTEQLNWTDKFWVVMFSWSFVLRYTLIFFIISSVICWLFRSILFSLHVFVFSVTFPL